MLVRKNGKKVVKGRKKSGSNLPIMVKFGLCPFPPQLFNTVKYTANFNLVISTGVGKYLFSCNGLFDPDFTGGGHQPLYFDQLAAIYDHYTVLSSRIKVKLGFTSTVTIPVISSVYIDDDTSVTVDAIQASERTPHASGYFVPAVEPSPWNRLSWSAADTFGGDPQSQDSLQGNSSTNPAEQSFYCIQGYDTSLASYTVVGYVELQYDTVWDEITTIAVS